MRRALKLLAGSAAGVLFLIYSLSGCAGSSSSEITSVNTSSYTSMISTTEVSTAASSQTEEVSSQAVSSISTSSDETSSRVSSMTSSKSPAVSVKQTSSKVQTTSSKKTSVSSRAASAAVSAQPTGKPIPVNTSIFAEYTKQHVKKLKDAVGDGTNKLVFTLMTDSHEHPGMLKITADNMAAVHKMIPSKVLIHLGDVIDGNKVKADSLKILEQTMGIIRGTGIPVLAVRGNHDDNSYQPDTSFNSIISNEEWYDLTQKDTDSAVSVVRQDHSPNYFYDIPDSKVRMIVLANNIGSPGAPVEQTGLNGKTFWGFSFNTLYWLGATALKEVPEGWQVAVFSHYPTRKDLCSYSTQPINGLQVEGVLQAFTQGTSYTAKDLQNSFSYEPTFDYENQGKRSIIGFFFGHIHSDIVLKPEGISFTYISTANSFGYAHADKSILPVGATVPSPRTPGTVYENCWDSVVVDTSAHIVKIFRYGAGNDRIIVY